MRLILALVGIVLAAAPLSAASPEFDRLYQLMRISDTVAILQQEGAGNARASAPELFEGAAPPGAWEDAVARIYQRDRLEAIVRAGFERGLDGVDLAPLVAFYGSDLGQKMVTLELTGRQAFADPGVEQDVRQAWRVAPEAAPHAAAIRRYVETNDLIERNVMAAMNADFLFLRAYFQADPGMSERRILSDVWSEEDAIRADAAEWLYAYLTLAYGPLSDAEMATNLALWQTPEGRALNRAMFGGFEAMFTDVSAELGRVAGRILAQEAL